MSNKNENNESKVYTLTDEELDLVSGGIGDDQPPVRSAMPCPRCQGNIPIDINELVKSDMLICPYCMLRIKTNTDNLRRAMERYLAKKGQ